MVHTAAPQQNNWAMYHCLIQFLQLTSFKQQLIGAAITEEDEVFEVNAQAVLCLMNMREAMMQMYGSSDAM